MPAYKLRFASGKCVSITAAGEKCADDRASVIAQTDSYVEIRLVEFDVSAENRSYSGHRLAGTTRRDMTSSTSCRQIVNNTDVTLCSTRNIIHHSRKEQCRKVLSFLPSEALLFAAFERDIQTSGGTMQLPVGERASERASDALPRGSPFCS